MVLAGLAWQDAGVSSWLGDAASAPSLLGSDPHIALARLGTALPRGAGPGPRERSAIVVAAREALRREPLDAVAIRQLALADDRSTDTVALARLRLAESISRRDILTQAALLELAAANSDYRAVLRHLDNALIAHPEAGSAIYPQLATLVAAPDFRRALATFAARPWFIPFLAAAVTTTPDPDDLAAIIIESRMELTPESADFLPIILTRLIDQGNYAGARQLAQSMRRTQSEAAFDDFRFNETTSDPRFAPLTWRIAASDAVQAQPTKGGGLEVEVLPGTSTLVADRITRMAPGNYELEQETGASDTSSPRLEWLVACKVDAGTQQPFWRHQVPSGLNRLRSRAALKIPTGCAVQHWQLRALADDRQIPGTVQLEALMLRRLN